MYKLYGRSGTGSDAPRMILEEANADYEFVDVTPAVQASADFKGLNSLGQLPVLMLPSGVLLTESAAICLHLAESLSDAALLPEAGSESRAAVYRWLFFAATNLYEDYRRHYHADRYISADHEGALRETTQVLLSKHWQLVDAALDNLTWISGDEFTVADIYLAMLSDWSVDRPALWEQCPAVARLCLAVGARPAAVKVGLAQQVIPAAVN